MRFKNSKEAASEIRIFLPINLHQRRSAYAPTFARSLSDCKWPWVDFSCPEVVKVAFPLDKIEKFPSDAVFQAPSESLEIETFYLNKTKRCSSELRPNENEVWAESAKELGNFANRKSGKEKMSDINFWISLISRHRRVPCSSEGAAVNGNQWFTNRPHRILHKIWSQLIARGSSPKSWKSPGNSGSLSLSRTSRLRSLLIQKISLSIEIIISFPFLDQQHLLIRNRTGSRSQSKSHEFR